MRFGLQLAQRLIPCVAQHLFIGPGAATHDMADQSEQVFEDIGPHDGLTGHDAVGRR